MGIHLKIQLKYKSKIIFLETWPQIWQVKRIIQLDYQPVKCRALTVMNRPWAVDPFRAGMSHTCGWRLAFPGAVVPLELIGQLLPQGCVSVGSGLSLSRHTQIQWTFRCMATDRHTGCTLTIFYPLQKHAHLLAPGHCVNCTDKRAVSCFWFIVWAVLLTPIRTVSQAVQNECVVTRLMHGT